MDIIGHLLVGVLVGGEVTPAVVVFSLLPDIGSIPLQFGKSWKNPSKRQLLWYKLWHSPLIPLGCLLYSEQAALLVLVHLALDAVTHKKPYWDLFEISWDYHKYYVSLLIGLALLCVARLYY